MQAIQDKLSALRGRHSDAVVGSAEGQFKETIVDLVEMAYYTFDAKGQATKAAIPKEVEADVADYRSKLVERAAEGDDDLTMKFLEEENLSQEEVVRGLQQGVAQGRIFPVPGRALPIVT